MYAQELPEIALILTVTDSTGIVNRVGTIHLSIEILDVNDNAPVFDQAGYAGAIDEGPTLQREILQVGATDADRGLNGQLTYALTVASGLFAVAGGTGVITNRAGMCGDAVVGQNFTLFVGATDAGSPSRDAVARVDIAVRHTNTFGPQFSLAEYGPFSLREDAADAVVGRITASDADCSESGEMAYSILSGNGDGVFRLDRDTGRVTQVAALDFEAVQNYTLVVQVRQQKTLFGSTFHAFHIFLSHVPPHTCPI